MALMTLFTVAVGLASGVIIGIFVERKAWNRLIDDGILPRPKE